MSKIKAKLGKLNGGPRLYVERDGQLVRLYERVLIRIEILGIGLELADMSKIKAKLGKLNGGPRLYVERDGQLVRLYERVLIRKILKS